MCLDAHCNDLEIMNNWKPSKCKQIVHIHPKKHYTVIIKHESYTYADMERCFMTH